MAYSDRRRAQFYSRLDGTERKFERYSVDELRGIGLYYSVPWNELRQLNKTELRKKIQGILSPVDIPQLTIAEKILQRKPSQLMENTWYTNALIEELIQYGAEQVSGSDIPPGKLCFFSYSAKWAERYPYWDRTPLAYILDQKEDRMLGANLHYLSDSLRNIYVRKVLNKDNEIFGAMPAKTLHTYIHNNIANVYIIPEDMQEYIGIAQLPTWDFISGDGINYADVRAIWDVPLNGKY